MKREVTKEAWIYFNGNLKTQAQVWVRLGYIKGEEDEIVKMQFAKEAKDRQEGQGSGEKTRCRSTLPLPKHTPSHPRPAYSNLLLEQFLKMPLFTGYVKNTLVFSHACYLRRA